MLIRCIVLKIWRFGFFADLAWNVYSHPQKCGFWVWTPKRDWSSSNPQKAHPWPEPALHGDFGGDRSSDRSSSSWVEIFHHYAKLKFGAKNVDRCPNYGPKSKSKMAAVRHLEFVTSSYRTTHEVFSLGHIGLSNFMLIWCIVLKIWRIGFWADLAQNAYSRPKNFVFLGSEPLNVIGHHRDPQKAHPWLEPHLHANFGTDRSTGAGEEIKKKEKRQGRNLQWQTECSPRPPTLTQRYYPICGLACRVVFWR